jgi:hypothetical protein
VIGDTTVTFTDAVLLSMVDFAVIVQVVGYSPARYSPLDEMLPHETVHVAAALALNCSVAFSLMVWLVLGVMVTDAAATPLAIKHEIRKTPRRTAFADMMIRSKAEVSEPLRCEPISDVRRSHRSRNQERLTRTMGAMDSLAGDRTYHFPLCKNN